MSRRNKNRPARRWGWRRVVLASVCMAILAAAGWYVRLTFLTGATAEPAPPAPAAGPPGVPEAPSSTSDYTRRVVAYIYQNEPVSREELGEYLIARHGPEKLGVLANKGLIERACRE